MAYNMLVHRIQWVTTHLLVTILPSCLLSQEI